MCGTRSASAARNLAPFSRDLRCGSTFAALAVLLGCAFGASDPNQGWIEVRSAHFVVSTNAGEKEAWRVADQSSRQLLGADDKVTAVRISIERMRNFI